MLFVRQARSVVALDTSSHMSTLNKLRMSSHGEVVEGKVDFPCTTCDTHVLHDMNQFARAQRSISEPPMDISFEVLVNQVSSDVFTAEKLQFLEVYRQGGLDRRREYSRKDT